MRSSLQPGSGQEIILLEGKNGEELFETDEDLTISLQLKCTEDDEKYERGKLHVISLHMRNLRH